MFLYEKAKSFLKWFSGQSNNWRELVFLALARGLLVFSLPTLFYSLIFSFQEKTWGIFWTHVISYLILIFILFIPHLPFNLRVHGMNIFLFSLSMISLFSHGLEGSGRIYLFIFVIMNGLFLGLRVGILALLLSAITLSIMGQLLYRGWLAAPWTQTTTIQIWIITALTFLALSTAMVTAISVFVQFLEKLLNQETILRKELQSTNEQLLVEMEERIVSQHEISQQHAQLQSILDNFPEMVYVCHPTDYEVVFVNRSMKKFLKDHGIKQELFGKPCYQVFQGREQPCQFCKIQFINQRSQEISWEHHNPVFDRHFLITDRFIQWTEGQQMHMGVILDITDRKLIEDQLKHDALHDSLTGLPNRQLLFERLERVVNCRRRNVSCHFALIFLDLDQFKLVNDTYGHSFGDQLLIETGRRLLDTVRDIDMVIRLGGDEFVVLLEDITDENDVYSVADRILNILSKPYHLEEHKVLITASMGVFIGDGATMEAGDVLRDADIAMYQAKAKGRNQYVIFKKEMLHKIQQRSQLERELRHAIEDHQFEVYYQPLINMKDSSISGFEALIRWNHPERGLLSPAAFWNVAEEVGLSIPIGQFVVNSSIQQIYQWQSTYQFPVPLMVSINFSPSQLQKGNIVELLQSSLNKSPINPLSVNVEITEDLVMKNFQEIAETLDNLRNLGVKIHLDDFGKAYSSLAKLHSISFDALKIDQEFVQDYLTQKRGIEIVQTIVKLAKKFNLKTVAEGVETQEQLNWLKKLDCDYWQGYLFAKPMPAKEVELFLSAPSPHPHL